jgi:hypothetical protein
MVKRGVGKTPAIESTAVGDIEVWPLAESSRIGSGHETRVGMRILVASPRHDE